MSDRYWDYVEARWARPPAPIEPDADAEVPAQRTSLDEVEEADVRSG